MAKAKAELRSLARSHTESAIKALAGVMNAKKSPAAARVAAAVALLDRGWGRPTTMLAVEPVEVRIKGEKPDLIDTARRIALILYQAGKEIQKDEKPEIGSEPFADGLADPPYADAPGAGSR